MRVGRVAGGSRVSPELASWLAVGLVAVGGAAASLGIAGGVSGRTPAAAVGGAVLAATATVLLAGGWARTHVLALLALTLPLPALLQVAGVRIAPVLLVTAVVVTAWALRHGAGPRRARLEAFPGRAVAALLGVATVSTLFAEAVAPAARELVSLGLLMALLAAAVHEITVRPRRAASLGLVLAALGAVAGGVAGLQAVGAVPSPFRLPGSSFYRATLGFEWPNEAAMLLALLVPFSVHAFVVARGSAIGRVLAGAGVTAVLVGLVATFSRGSWLAALAAPAVLLLTGDWRTVLRVWIGAAVLAAVVDVASGGALSARAMRTIGDPLVGQRLALTFTGLLMAAENPVLGVGPGGFGPALEAYGPQVAVLWDYVGSAHNTYVQVAAETGLPGLLALLALLWTVLRALLRGARRARRDDDIPPEEASLRRTALWAFGTACLVGMVEWSLTQGVGQLVMLTAAIGLGLEAAGREAGREGAR